ncbi:MAG: tripartite tricarboxylate transporter substrate binding protein [Homoserinimonas sp.]
MNVRRSFARRCAALLTAGAIVSALAACSASTADEGAAVSNFPTRPIDVVVPFPAGGSTDSVARGLVDAINKEGTFAHALRVVNREGGNGTIGVNEVLQSKADGHTIGFVGPAPFVLQPFISDVPYDPDAFTPVVQITSVDYAIAVPAGSPYDTLEDLVDAADAAPGSISIAQGALPYTIAVRMLEREADIKLNPVDFAGDAPALTALLGGNIDAMVGQTAGIAAQLDAGAVKVLAVLSTERSSALADIPTAVESGWEVLVNANTFVFGPDALQDDVTEELSEAFAAAALSGQFEELMAGLAQTIDVQDGSQVRKQMASDKETFAPLLQQ